MADFSSAILGRLEADVNLLSFDSLKFEALDYFMARLSESETVGIDLDEWELDFLERCDQALLEEVTSFLCDYPISECHDGELRDELVTRIESMVEVNAPLTELRESCFDSLEQLEDVTENWLILGVLGASRLKSLYKVLETTGELTPESQEVFVELLCVSPLVNGDDWMHFNQLACHLNEVGFLAFLNRFLSAHLEYGVQLQDKYIQAHPELIDCVVERFKGLK